MQYYSSYYNYKKYIQKQPSHNNYTFNLVFIVCLNTSNNILLRYAGTSHRMHIIR